MFSAPVFRKKIRAKKNPLQSEGIFLFHWIFQSSVPSIPEMLREVSRTGNFFVKQVRIVRTAHPVRKEEAPLQQLDILEHVPTFGGQTTCACSGEKATVLRTQLAIVHANLARKGIEGTHATARNEEVKLATADIATNIRAHHNQGFAIDL
jgi:hypothetical protein